MKKPWKVILSSFKNSEVVLCCLAMIICTQLNGQQALILDKVLAKVGGEHVLYSEVQELYGYAKQQNPTYDANIQCDILEQLIAKKLLLDQAKLDSIEISEVELDIELQRRIDYILSQMGGSEETFYEYYGKTPIEQREAMREPLREDLIQQRIQGQLIQDVTITPQETVDFFNRIPKDSLPFRSAEVEVGEITIKTRIREEIKEQAREKLESLRNRIVEGGEKFEDLASVFSDDVNSARIGGDLGWAKRGTFVPEFEATAYSLEKGEVSDIVETDFGFHVLQLIDRRGNNINVRHILIRPEITPEDVEATKQFLDSVAHMISVDSISFELAVKLYSNEDAQSYNNAGRLINPKTGDTFWETKELPYQIYFAIESLEVGEISEVLEFEERGEKVFKIIQLQSKTRPHVVSLETDYSWIQDFAKESKKNEYFNSWMDEKIRNTFIDIIPQYEGCPNLAPYLTNRSIRP